MTIMEKIITFMIVCIIGVVGFFVHLVASALLNL